MTGGWSRLLASRDSSLASAREDHPPVGVDFVNKSGSVEFSMIYKFDFWSLQAGCEAPFILFSSFFFFGLDRHLMI